MEFDELFFTSLFNLLVAAFLGGVIGFERAGKNHDAGLRTHILVCIGSATVMILSTYLARDYNQLDITRLGAQVISGIGFLGVGSIIVTRDRVRGLTTAAGLWTTACVGLVVGMGYHLIAAAVVALMLIAILGLRPIAMKFQRNINDIKLCVTINNKDVVSDLFVFLKETGFETIGVCLENVNLSDMKVILELNSNKDVDKDELLFNLCSLDGVKQVSII